VCLSVCLSVGRSVGLSVTVVSCAKTGEPIDMSFGIVSEVDPGKHVLDGDRDPPCARAIVRGKAHCKIYMNLCRELCKNGSTDRDAVWLWTGPRKHVLDRVHASATWRIRLNRLCATAMGPFCRIT